MKKISRRALIVDTNAGNLFSLKSALERLGFVVDIAKRPPIKRVDCLVIPGQGRFAQVLNNLRKQAWPSFLEDCRASGMPILGICVGMQIFFESSEEDPACEGLAWFDGAVRKLNFPKQPMIGWAQLDSSLWPNAAVYFVNSYAIKNSPHCVAKTHYGETFCAAIKTKSFTGLQFHPEKSSSVGAQIISQALALKGVTR